MATYGKEKYKNLTLARPKKSVLNSFDVTIKMDFLAADNKVELEDIMQLTGFKSL